MEINNNNKKPIIRNASGISAYDKEYYKNYAKIKNMEKRRCEACDIELTYYCISKHNKSKKHLKNIEKQNL